MMSNYTSGTISNALLAELFPDTSSTNIRKSSKKITAPIRDLKVQGEAAENTATSTSQISRTSKPSANENGANQSTKAGIKRLIHRITPSDEESYPPRKRRHHGKMNHNASIVPHSSASNSSSLIPNEHDHSTAHLYPDHTNKFKKDDTHLQKMVKTWIIELFGLTINPTFNAKKVTAEMLELRMAIELGRRGDELTQAQRKLLTDSINKVQREQKAWEDEFKALEVRAKADDGA